MGTNYQSHANKPPISYSGSSSPTQRPPVYYRTLFRHLLHSTPRSKRQSSQFKRPPPITTFSIRLDDEIYTFLALLIRDFVKSWYDPISQDQDFIKELVEIIVRILKELERRIRRVDWIKTLLLEAPLLAQNHYRDYRTATQKFSTTLAGNQTFESLFHGSQPHFALSDGPAREHEYLRILTDQLLCTLLTKEDYESNCVRVFLRETLCNLVLKNAVTIISNPFMVNTIICKLLSRYNDEIEEMELYDPITIGPNPNPILDEKKPSLHHPRSAHVSTERSNEIISSLHEAQSTTLKLSPSPRKNVLSAEKNTNTIATQNLNTSSSSPSLPNRTRHAKNNIPSAPVEPEQSAPLPPPTRPSHLSLFNLTIGAFIAQFTTFLATLYTFVFASQEEWQRWQSAKRASRHEQLEIELVEFVGEMFQLNKWNAWLWGQWHMFIRPLLRGLAGGLIDKILEHSLAQVFSEDRIIWYVQIGRETLWPGGVLVADKDPPSWEEQERMRIEAERRIGLLFPETLKIFFFGSSPENHALAVHDALVPLQNLECNKHLVYLCLDLLVGRICPELTEGGLDVNAEELMINEKK